MKYMITPFNKFKGYKSGVIEAKTPLSALKIYLKTFNIQYNSIQKMTAKVNQELLDAGYDNMQIADLIDFIISKENDYNPASGGSYRLL